ncbi:MAG: ATP-binding protein, partial [Arcobacteraceae bacterium]|nr:ATP-binding protein [Arcobacteraceae bacterium]
VDDVINIFGTYFNVNNIKIVNNVENMTIVSYANGLQQVLLNIVKNAKDAVERDGIIYLQSQILDDGRLELRIKDSGGGIPENIMDRVFDPYFTTKHKSQGTGIGLNMSYQIVKEHLNGTIDVQNSEFIYNGQTYKGAEFILSIRIK